MRAIVYTYQGEEFEGDYLGECFRNDEEWWATIALDDGTFARVRFKDVRAIIMDRLEDVPEDDDPPSSGAAPQPSEPPEESSAPEGT